MKFLKKAPKLSPHIVGTIGLLAMIISYFLILFLITKDIYDPFYIFLGKWYFITPMFVGFGFQMYLFQKLRFIIVENSVKMTATSAGTSGLAMVACCAHRLADILPFLGFVGVATAMTKYQNWFLTVGVLTNLIGVWYMWTRIQKQKKDGVCGSRFNNN